MPEKDPTTYSLITYAWVIIVACAGGIAGFHRKMREGAARPFNITEFIGEIFTSGLVGIVTFWMCEWAGVAPLLSAVFIAISGHMGSRTLLIMEKWVEAKWPWRLK